MRDYVSIASAPYDEPCVMVTDKEPYLDAMKAECRRFLELIRKKLGEEPPGASLALKSNPHDFGTYYDVVCYYDNEDEDGADYAYRCESDAPRTWDDDHLSPLEVARERTRQAIRQGLCQQCGEHIEDPELLTEHMRDHVRSHQASQAKNQAT